MSAGVDWAVGSPRAVPVPTPASQAGRAVAKAPEGPAVVVVAEAEPALVGTAAAVNASAEGGQGERYSAGHGESVGEEAVRLL